MHRLIHCLLCVFALIVISGCVRNASDDTAPQVGAELTFTPEPPPSQTPPPTDAASETPLPTVEPSETPLLPTEPVDNIITETPIPIPSETSTATATATEAFAGLVQGTAIAQNDSPPLAEQEPTADPNAGGLTESQLLATAIIANATATESFIQTQAALEAIGATIPTATSQPAVDQEGELESGIDDGSDGGSSVVVPVAGADCIHEVRPIDRNLYRLSIAYGVSVQDIAVASGIVNPNLIRIGQRLTIPGCGTTGGVPPATSTPNPNNPGGGGGVVGGGGGGSIGGLTPCGVSTSVQFPNGCPQGSGNVANSGNVGSTAGGGGAAVGGTGSSVVTGSGGVHVVAQGETLYEISLFYNVPIVQIAAANGITDYDSIRFNQSLTIP